MSANDLGLMAVGCFWLIIGWIILAGIDDAQHNVWLGSIRWWERWLAAILWPLTLFVWWNRRHNPWR